MICAFWVTFSNPRPERSTTDSPKRELCARGRKGKEESGCLLSLVESLDVIPVLFRTSVPSISFERQALDIAHLPILNVCFDFKTIHFR